MHKKLLLATVGAIIFFTSFGAAGVISDFTALKFHFPSWASVLIYLALPTGMYFIVTKKSRLMSYGYNASAICVLAITVLLMAAVLKDGNFSESNKAQIIAKLESYKHKS